MCSFVYFCVFSCVLNILMRFSCAFKYFRVFLSIWISFSCVFNYFRACLSILMRLSCGFKYLNLFLVCFYVFLLVFMRLSCVFVYFRAFLWPETERQSLVTREGTPTTTLQNLPDPSLNAPRNKISGKGKPLTLKSIYIYIYIMLRRTGKPETQVHSTSSNRQNSELDQANRFEPDV